MCDGFNGQVKGRIRSSKGDKCLQSYLCDSLLLVIENGLWLALCVRTSKAMILFLVLASHLKYMAGNLFSVWPRHGTRPGPEAGV